MPQLYPRFSLTDLIFEEPLKGSLSFAKEYPSAYRVKSKLPGLVADPLHDLTANI